MLIIGKPDVFVWGGFWDGTLFISQIDIQGKYFMLKAHSQTVSSIAFDNKDIIITGSKKGDTKLWKID